MSNQNRTVPEWINASGCVAIGGLVIGVFSLLVSIGSCVSTMQANGVAQSAVDKSHEANEISKSANYLAVALNERSNALQTELAQLAEDAKRPAIHLLRCVRSADGSIWSTIQNTGERQAAVFSVGYAVIPPGMVTGPPPAKSVSDVPSENLAHRLVVQFNEPADRDSHNFVGAVVLEPGQVVTIQWKFGFKIGRADLHLVYGNDEVILIGSTIVVDEDGHEVFHD